MTKKLDNMTKEKYNVTKKLDDMTKEKDKVTKEKDEIMEKVELLKNIAMGK